MRRRQFQDLQSLKAEVERCFTPSPTDDEWKAVADALKIGGDGPYDVTVAWAVTEALGDYRKTAEVEKEMLDYRDLWLPEVMERVRVVRAQLFGCDAPIVDTFKLQNPDDVASWYRSEAMTPYHAQVGAIAACHDVLRMSLAQKSGTIKDMDRDLAEAVAFFSRLTTQVAGSAESPQGQSQLTFVDGSRLAHLFDACLDLSHLFKMSAGEAWVLFLCDEAPYPSVVTVEMAVPLEGFFVVGDGDRDGDGGGSEVLGEASLSNIMVLLEPIVDEWPFASFYFTVGSHQSIDWKVRSPKYTTAADIADYWRFAKMLTEALTGGIRKVLPSKEHENLARLYQSTQGMKAAQRFERMKVLHPEQRYSDWRTMHATFGKMERRYKARNTTSATKTDEGYVLRIVRDTRSSPD